MAVLEEELAKRFYGSSEEEPRYCSIDKANDLSFLRLVSSVTFVIYQRHTRFGLLRVFDNRVQLAASLGGLDPSPALVFMLHDSGDGLRLYECDREDSLGAEAMRDLTRGIALAGSVPVPVGDCLALNAILLGGEF